MPALALSGLTRGDHLALAAQRGEPGALVALLAQYQPLLLSTAHAYRIPGHGPEDLLAVAESCLWKLLAAFDPGRGSWGSLAKKSLGNVMLSLLDKETRARRWPGRAPLSLQDPEMPEPAAGGGTTAWSGAGPQDAVGGDVAAAATVKLHGEQVREAARRSVPDPVDRLILDAILNDTPLTGLTAACGLSHQRLSDRRQRLLARLKGELSALAP